MPSSMVKTAVRIAVFAVIASLFLSRAGVLYRFYANAPGRLRSVNNFGRVEVKFQDELRNCEDLALDNPRHFAMLSCDPGRDTWNTVMGTFTNATAPPETGLYILHYLENDAKPIKMKLLNFSGNGPDFHPLGVSYDFTTKSLFVVNHAPSGSTIEQFTVQSDEATAKHVLTIKHPLLSSPNSVHAFSAYELFVTNDHYFLQRSLPWLSLLETYLGLPGGGLFHVNLRYPTSPKVTRLARVPFANGVVALNHTAVAVASSSTNAVYIYNVHRTDMEVNSILHPQMPAEILYTNPPTAKLMKTLKLPFIPDNLHLDYFRYLIIAGHPHAPTLEKIAKNSARCNAPGTEGKEDCLTGSSWIAEWSELKGYRTLFVGDKYGTASTAVRDGLKKVGIAVGLYAKGIMVWTER